MFNLLTIEFHLPIQKPISVLHFELQLFQWTLSTDNTEDDFCVVSKLLVTLTEMMLFQYT